MTTDEEIRRIRRIVAGDPSSPPLPSPVDPRQAERFQRALGGTRRAVASIDSFPSREAPSAPPPATGRRKEKGSTHQSAAGAAVAQHAVASPAATQQAVASPTVAGRRPPPPAPVKALAARESPGADDTHGPHPTPGSPNADRLSDSLSRLAGEGGGEGLPSTPTSLPIPPVAWTPLPPHWEQELADTVTALCRASDPAFHSWTIQVPIDAESLPHTELRLTFSPHHLLLRFSTQSTRSLALISAHQSQLRALLVRALPSDRHIDIEIT